MKKSEVQFHSDGNRYNPLPAINVKVYKLGLTVKAVRETFNCDTTTAEKALEYAFNLHQQLFWDDAEESAREVFGQHVKVYSQGCSGGWLVVKGLKDFERWDAIDVSRWSKFVMLIKDHIDHHTNGDGMEESIRSNEWYKVGSEEYNFVDTNDGKRVCVADMKAEAVSKGFGPVVR